MNRKIAKVSVEKFNSDEKILYEFNKEIDLFENVKAICELTKLPTSHVYGLKFLPAKDNTNYISEANYHAIENNDHLKIVFSIEYTTNFIHEYLEDETTRSVSFKFLMEVCWDPVFIEELVKNNRHIKLIESYICGKELTTNERLALLKTIVQLLQKNYIKDKSHDILSKALLVLKDCDEVKDEFQIEEIKYTLVLLEKILVNKNEDFNTWKKMIIRELPPQEITAYISHKKLQYSAILLINTMISLCKDHSKQTLIREMNSTKIRENVFEFIIKRGDLDKLIEHELYVLQTHILSLYNDALKSTLLINNNKVFNKDEFELSPEELKRIAVLTDFDELSTNRRISVESVLTGQWNNSELSLNSLYSTDGISSNRSSRESTLLLRKKRLSELKDDQMVISYLTLDCLRHYKRHHYSSFRQSQIEEHLYEPGIFVTSQRVVQMLAKILHINKTPDTKSTLYQPLVFFCIPSCSPQTPFFWELFALTMWLLSKTRKEMRATTFEDYAKVMTVLEKQIKMALKSKLDTIEIFLNELSNNTFTVVLGQIQKEKEQQFQKLAESNFCILELKKTLTKENDIYVQKHRINCLITGEYFPVVLGKKIGTGKIFVKLCQNMKDIMIYNLEGGELKFQEKYKVDDITHLAVGINCKHSNLCSVDKTNLAFSIIVDHQEKTKFIAKDKFTAIHWIDGLCLLTGKHKLSEEYKKNVNDLVEMDLRLKLMDLQNIDIPKLPPTIPPFPDD